MDYDILICKGMIYMIKLIAMDMDGTLLNSNQEITSYTKEVLMSWQDKGVGIVLASGRDIKSLKEYGEMLHITEYSQSGYICLNGLMIWNSSGKTIYKHNGLTYDESVVLEALAKKYAMDIIFFFGDNLFIIEYGYTGIMEQHFVSFTKHKVQRVQEIPQKYFHSLRKVAFVQKEDIINKVIVSLQDDVKNQFDLCRVESDWIEINPYRVNKGNALKQYADIKGIPLEDVLAFGNGENDIEMLKVAGKGIAMDNSFDSVKKIADDICGSCDFDGIGKYLKNDK